MKWNDENFRAKWRHTAYRAVMYVSERLRSRDGYNRFVLPNLHIAAYMCYAGEVSRLVESGEADVHSPVSSRAPKTARGLLERIIKLAEQKGRPWSAETLADTRDVIEYLKLMEGSQRPSGDA
jgi:hypothetical protein